MTMTSDLMIDSNYDLESSTEQEIIADKSNLEEESSKSLLGSALADSFHSLRLRSINESFNTLSGNPLNKKDNKIRYQEPSQECIESLSNPR